MADTKNDYGKFDERMREVEGTLTSHLATCTEAGKGVKKALSTLSGQVESVENSVEKLSNNVKELDIEKAKAKGVAKGINVAFTWVFGFITIISVLLNIYFLLIK